MVHQGEILPFEKLLEDFNISKNYFFRYMQLSHALPGQFSQGQFQLMESNLEQVTRTDLLIKHISSLYDHLVSVSLLEIRSLREQWLEDILESDEEKWED